MKIKIEKLDYINDKDQKDILNVWNNSVRTTHHFLSEHEITLIEPQVIKGINYVDNLFCIRSDNGNIISFLGVHNKKLEMLFVDASLIRQGLL